VRTIAIMDLKASLYRFPVLIAVVLLAGMLAGQGVLRDFVLCLGTDGHVALEPAAGLSGTCETRPAQQPDRKLTLQWSPDYRSLGQHCGPCEDFILARSTLTYSKPSRLQSSFGAVSQVGAPLAAMFQLPADSNRSIKHLDHFLHRAPPSSSLSVLRSTILLI
jgi:hypothetical protein